MNNEKNNITIAGLDYWLQVGKRSSTPHASDASESCLIKDTASIRDPRRFLNDGPEHRRLGNVGLEEWFTAVPDQNINIGSELDKFISPNSEARSFGGSNRIEMVQGSTAISMRYGSRKHTPLDIT